MSSVSLTGLATSVTFDENTVNAAPQLLDADVTFTATSANFAGGQLTLSGLTPDDILSVRNQGTAAGQIGLNGSDVTFGGTVIGSLSGGVGATLTIDFTANTTAASVEALVENLTYANSSGNPYLDRSLTLNISDADGAQLSSPGATTTFAQDAFGGLLSGLSIPSNSQPDFVDLDLDGDLDLVVGSLSSVRVFLRDANGAFVATGALDGNPLANVNRYLLDYDLSRGAFGQARTAFGDYDLDGDLDLALTRYSDGSTTYFSNDDGTYYIFGVYNPFDGISTGFNSSSTLVDLDNDGDVDLVGAAESGTLKYWLNDGGAYRQLAGSFSPLNGVDAPGVVSTAFADLNSDGLLDLVAGIGDGTLRAWTNTGTWFSELTGTNNPFAGIDVGFLAAPTFADLDGDGDLDLIVGSAAGNLTYFENTTATGQSIFVQLNPQNDAPTGTDLPTAATVVQATATALDLSALVLNDAEIDVITLRIEATDGTFAAASTFDVTAVVNGSTLTLNGQAARLMDYLDNLNAVKYISAAGVLGAGAASLDVYATDGMDESTVGTITLTVTSPYTTITGTEGKDNLKGTAAAEVINALGGNDVVRGLAGGDTIDGGAGIDTLQYTGSNVAVGVDLHVNGFGFQLAVLGHATGDVIKGFENVTGSSFGDILSGNDLANALTGGDGRDILTAFLGNDVLNGGRGNDYLDGGDGIDTVVYTGSQGAVMVDLHADADDVQYASGGDATGDQLVFIENVKGSRYGDTLIGDSHRNGFVGGGGSDTFVFSDALGGANVDRIGDFKVGEDTILLNTAIFTALSISTFGSNQVEVNTTGLATAEAARIIYESDTGRLYYDADGSLSGQGVLFAQLARGLAISDLDFALTVPLF